MSIDVIAGSQIPSTEVIVHCITLYPVNIIFQGAEFVVALTHMRGPNDHRLAEEATGIDLVLGGHDHDYFVQKVCAICSKTWYDLFEFFGKITLVKQD